MRLRNEIHYFARRDVDGVDPVGVRRDVEGNFARWYLDDQVRTTASHRRFEHLRFTYAGDLGAGMSMILPVMVIKISRRSVSAIVPLLLTAG